MRDGTIKINWFNQIIKSHNFESKVMILLNQTQPHALSHSAPLSQVHTADKRTREVAVASKRRSKGIGGAEISKEERRMREIKALLSKSDKFF